jgi:hypothetical protein
MMPAELPSALARGGRIGRRQTTYWDVSTLDGPRIRVHFDGKAEFAFVDSNFEGAELASRHPLLTEYEHPSDDLYVSSPVHEPEGVLAALRAVAAKHFARWRPLERYLNATVAEQVLHGGYGLLIRGPREFVSDAAATCLEQGVKFSVTTGPDGRSGGQFQALVLGRNFVIARSFRFT